MLVFQKKTGTPPGWDLSGASLEYTFSASAQEGSPSGIAFKPDGLEMYIIGFGSATKKVQQYTLSSAWDLSSASHTAQSPWNVPEVNSGTLQFKPDGTEWFTVGQITNTVYRTAVSTPWDITTSASSTNDTYSVAAQDTSPTSVSFKPDGLRMWVVGDNNDRVYQYDLSTAWQPSSATLSSPFGNMNLTTQTTNPRGWVFRTDDGSKMYLLGGAGSNTLFEYDPVVGNWSLFGTFGGTTVSISPAVASWGLAFSADGTKFYVTDANNGNIYQYAL